RGSVFGFGISKAPSRRPEPKTEHRISLLGSTHKASPSKNLAENAVDQRSDELLLNEYMRGDRAAFTRLMSRYSNELIHFLTRFLGSRAAADDVFQETFLQIHLS